MWAVDCKVGTTCLFELATAGEELCEGMIGLYRSMFHLTCVHVAHLADVGLEKGKSSQKDVGPLLAPQLKRKGG